jgi:hypothetical protein
VRTKLLGLLEERRSGSPTVEVGMHVEMLEHVVCKRSHAHDLPVFLRDPDFIANHQAADELAMLLVGVQHRQERQALEGGNEDVRDRGRVLRSGRPDAHTRDP